MFNFGDSFMFERMFEFRYRDRLLVYPFFVQTSFKIYSAMPSLSVGVL
ncbi:hypothetical protein HDC90_000717 [Pedobacter sp. AK013]|nr:hypothetical protein [Pedobacter sp. AK013]